MAVRTCPQTTALGPVALPHRIRGMRTSRLGVGLDGQEPQPREESEAPSWL
jgi:hypothetical protein